MVVFLGAPRLNDNGEKRGEILGGEIWFPPYYNYLRSDKIG
jgi:hypothetical protein